MTAEIVPTVNEVLRMSTKERQLLRNDLARRELDLVEETMYIGRPNDQNERDLLMELALVSDLLDVIRELVA
ncbi:hypothetical protein UFOVP184_13 [uncultured Caudovirales phage]|uniref:Uncharacterized protein n=1 Tax=uncultured Caudovirales phage TaxID=2100421 RepID=A0A6J7WGE4_9CAUD|nr:hypothetical protein UFOVP184_13 [uncultured Caudovirales phage]